MHAVGWRAGANQRVGRSRRDPEFESRYLQRRVGNELFPALGAHDAVGRETTKETGALLLAIGGLAAAFGQRSREALLARLPSRPSRGRSACRSP